MAITLYFLSGFNNYYNRTIKMPDETNVSAYSDYIIKTDEVEKFNPNDGVMSTLTLNYWDPPYDIDDAYDVDYLLVSLTNPQKIDSKWFILDRRRKAEQQWELTIRRDLVSDNYDDVINAPCFIEKATLDASSPFLFNLENMAFNQIKQEEILLKDGSNCPWIVGYYAKNIGAEYLKGTVDANDLDKAYDEIIDVPFTNWKYNATLTPFYGSLSTVEYRIYFKDMVGGLDSQPGYFEFDKDGNFVNQLYVSDTDNLSSLDLKNKYASVSNKDAFIPLFKDKKANLFSCLEVYVPSYNSETTINEFLSYNGKVIKDSDGKYYQLAIYSVGNKTEVLNIEAGILYNALASIVVDSGVVNGSPNTNSFKVEIVRAEYGMVATELTNRETTWDMSGEKLITDDAPYNIFAIPFGITQLEQDGYAVATSNSVIAMAVANSIIRVMGDNLYDIQLLPYCPINTPMGNGILAMYDIDAYSIVKSPGGETLEYHPCYILNVPKAKFSKNLNYTISVPDTAVEKKVMNECEMYRLCSPNYNGAFEFSPAKNNGVTYFNVDCEYKPFQPYIHINPNFGGMYGRDFDDARGLICNGDFSLTQIKDAWQNYQIQNKNYQEIFSRQIENMEATRDIQRTQEKWGIAAGAITAGASTAGTAMMMGGGPGVGTIAGLVGAGVSAISGAVDYSMSEKLHSMSLDYTKDMFGYNLSNIKALPYTLTKVSAYNNNNKLFPFVERYSATDEEKEAFRKKLEYNGMSVGVIGNIIDYIQAEPSYVKGSIIRIDGNTQLDYHTLSELSNEIYKGVFI